MSDVPWGYCRECDECFPLDAQGLVPRHDRGLPTAWDCYGGGESPMPVELGDVLEEFDDWIECTGALAKHSSWYCEAKSIIEQAFKAGVRSKKVEA